VSRPIAVLFAVFCLVAPDAPAEQPKQLRILFIGNSLTAANDLPSLVTSIGDADGIKIATQAVAFNDFGLAEHWTDGRALREIRNGRWDFVVLQQGPSALPESRVVLRDYVARFAPVIREAAARPALYMVWPSLQRSGDFERVRESYALAAADVGAVLLPAGDAWHTFWRQTPEPRLYAQDDFHPSASGSWLAALVIYCGLTERSPNAVKLPAGFPKPRALFVAAAANALHTAAAK
jgi:hypothetical protein